MLNRKRFATRDELDAAFFAQADEYRARFVDAAVILEKNAHRVRVGFWRRTLDTLLGKVRDDDWSVRHADMDALWQARCNERLFHAMHGVWVQEFNKQQEEERHLEEVIRRVCGKRK